MSCSIFHDNFQMFMQNSDIIMRMNLSNRKVPKSFRQYYGGALQNPDLKRVELAAMLRDAEREQLGRTGSRSFKTSTAANTNE